MRARRFARVSPSSVSPIPSRARHSVLSYLQLEHCVYLHTECLLTQRVRRWCPCLVYDSTRYIVHYLRLVCAVSSCHHPTGPSVGMMRLLVRRARGHGVS